MQRINLIYIDHTLLQIVNGPGLWSCSWVVLVDLVQDERNLVRSSGSPKYNPKREWSRSRIAESRIWQQLYFICPIPWTHGCKFYKVLLVSEPSLQHGWSAQGLARLGFGKKYRNFLFDAFETLTFEK